MTCLKGASYILSDVWEQRVNLVFAVKVRIPDHALREGVHPHLVAKPDPMNRGLHLAISYWLMAVSFRGDGEES
jgi:hypothetical protein